MITGVMMTTTTQNVTILTVVPAVQEMIRTQSGISIAPNVNVFRNKNEMITGAGMHYRFWPHIPHLPLNPRIGTLGLLRRMWTFGPTKSVKSRRKNVLRY